MLSQLHDKFDTAEKRSTKLQVLTILPKSWTINKLEKEFAVTNYMARSVKKLVDEKGILSTLNPKPGWGIPNSTIATVKEFYASDEINRAMPGEKDAISVKIDGEKVRLSKRLLMCNIREASTFSK